MEVIHTKKVPLYYHTFWTFTMVLLKVSWTMNYFVNNMVTYFTVHTILIIYVLSVLFVIFWVSWTSGRWLMMLYSFLTISYEPDQVHIQTKICIYGKSLGHTELLSTYLGWNCVECFVIQWVLIAASKQSSSVVVISAASSKHSTPSAVNKLIN